jgi:FKBP-type peptidyl-prolyl cis-trans isomerase
MPEMLGLVILVGCGGAAPVPDVAVGEELPAAAAAEQDTSGARVAISERELKSAERAARRAEARRKQAQSANNRNQQRQANAAPEPDEPVDSEAAAPQSATDEEELPRDPSPPDTVPPPADVAMPPADAAKTATGLFSKVLNKGRGGPLPTPGSKVVVHYSGWTTDGRLFDSSVVRGQPIRLPLAQVIPGWREGVMLMTVGEKRRLWIPEKLAYQGKSGAPAGMLVFDVELLRIE